MIVFNCDTFLTVLHWDGGGGATIWVSNGGNWPYNEDFNVLILFIISSLANLLLLQPHRRKEVYHVM